MEDTLGKKYPDALNANLEGMRRGYDELRILDVSMGEEIATEQQGQEEKNNATDCVNKNTRIGGNIRITAAAEAVPI